MKTLKTLIKEAKVIAVVNKKTKRKWQFTNGMKVKWNGETYDTGNVKKIEVIELKSDSGGYRTLKLDKKDIEDGLSSGVLTVKSIAK
jgi:hypothetical protein